MSKIFASRLKSLRKSSGMTQEKLGDKFNMTKTAISYWENSKSEPSFEMIIKLARLFNVEVSYLIGDSDEQNLSISGNDNNSSQSNNNSGTITTITNNYSDCDSNTKQKNHQESIHQKNIETLYAIIDELKKMSDEDMQQVLRYACLLNK